MGHGKKRGVGGGGGGGGVEQAGQTQRTVKTDYTEKKMN